MRLVPIALILLFVCALVVLIAGVPQIINGGFEQATVSTTPSANAVSGWTAVGAVDFAVLDQTLGPSDAGMPVEGDRWLVLSAQGSAAATPATGTGAPSGTVSLIKTFQMASGQTKLEVSAVFLSDELPGGAWRDFLSIDVTDGQSSWNVLHLDTDSPMNQQSNVFAMSIGGAPMPATEVVTAFVDLPTVFPSADAATVFTVALSMGNALDGSLPSRGYVDRIRLVAGSPLPGENVSLGATLLADGAHRLDVTAPGFPGAELRQLFSASVAAPVGAGPLLGLTPDDLTWQTLWQPLGAAPFRVLLDANGSYSFTIPAWVAPGVTVDVLAVLLDGGVVAFAGPVRFTL